MDDPDLDEAEHLRALRGLRTINRISHAAGALASPVLRVAHAHHKTHLSLLDVACGGGDVATSLAAKLRHHGITVDLTLLDRSAVALRQAASTAEAAGIAARTLCQDALAPLPDADVITNSLFLHHLERDQVITLLGNMSRAARHAIVISDLTRSRLGWVLAWAGCRVLSRSRIVHDDGPVSVAAAWSPAELDAMMRQAQMSSMRMTSQWPCRVLLEWDRHDG